MDRKEQLKIFVAQTKNVRELGKAWRHLKRTINRELVGDNCISVALHTKLLVLVFCAWSEANFSKLIHTPHGFEIDEIEQIKKAAKQDIVAGWKKCLGLGLKRVLLTSKSNYKPNIKQALERIIITYIDKPRLLRNKIAHGQWKTALNANNDDTNTEMTNQINGIDVVQLDIWREAYQGLSNIIEALIESPEKAFHKDYLLETSRVEKKLIETASWSLDDKIRLLKEKKRLRK